MQAWRNFDIFLLKNLVISSRFRSNLIRKDCRYLARTFSGFGMEKNAEGTGKDGSTAEVRSGGEVVKSASQLKKDAKRLEKLEKFKKKKEQEAEKKNQAEVFSLEPVNICCYCNVPVISVPLTTVHYMNGINI